MSDKVTQDAEALLFEIKPWLAGNGPKYPPANYGWHTIVMPWLRQMVSVIQELMERLRQVEKWNDERLDDVDALATERDKLRIRITSLQSLLGRIQGQALHHPKEDRELLRQRLRDISSWCEAEFNA